MPLVRRTRAIFRIAELGFLGVLVVTLVATPRLKGELKETGLFFRVLKPLVKATALVLRVSFFLFFLTSWLIVDIKNPPKGDSHCTKRLPKMQTGPHIDRGTQSVLSVQGQSGE